MTTLSIQLPDSLLTFVREQAAQGGFESPGDFVRDLLRDLQRRAAKKRVEALLLEGLHEGGEDIVADEQFWQEMIREYEERHSRTDGSKADGPSARSDPSV